MLMNACSRINAMALVQIYLARIYANAHTEPMEIHMLNMDVKTLI